MKYVTVLPEFNLMKIFFYKLKGFSAADVKYKLKKMINYLTVL
jgi:hypothetical protein